MRIASSLNRETEERRRQRTNLNLKRRIPKILMIKETKPKEHKVLKVAARKVKN